VAQDKGQVPGSCQPGNRLFGSVEGGEFLDCLSDISSEQRLFSMELVNLDHGPSTSTPTHTSSVSVSLSLSLNTQKVYLHFT
jgi:hypothetical protein